MEPNKLNKLQYDFGQMPLSMSEAKSQMNEQLEHDNKYSNGQWVLH